MTNPIDFDRLCARASELRHTIAYAIDRLIHPGLTRLRKALSRLEDDVRFWLLWMYFSAPEGTYDIARNPTNAAPPARTHTVPADLKLAPQTRVFVLRIGQAAYETGDAPAQNDSRDWAKPRPTRDETLNNFSVRMAALFATLHDPQSALQRIARRLARKPLITIVTRDLVDGDPARNTRAIDIQLPPAPKPHKRE
jgi:hypothetical protein